MLLVFFGYLINLPHFLFLVIKDYIKYIRNKEWLLFEGWGLHLYVGRFGAGKTASMVERAYRLANRYPQLTIMTNIKLIGFPAHTALVPLNCADDILNAPQNTLVLIDEIGTIFNSRDFTASKNKESVPKILFQHICQCRKRRLMILATTQCWNFLDKQLRDIAATVNVTRSNCSHPFTRISAVYTYDAKEYDKAYTNPMYPLPLQFGYVYVQTNKLRNLYDTSELVQTMLKAEYLPDSEILANRGVQAYNMTEVDKKKIKLKS